MAETPEARSARLRRAAACRRPEQAAEAGRARQAAMTPAQRRKLARLAARARWASKPTSTE